MADQQILMTVPKEVIDANVKAAVVSALNRDPEALVRAVVAAAMAQKDDRYGSKPIWEEKVNEMIRDVAVASFNEWLEEQKPLIAKTVRSRLEEKFRGPRRGVPGPLVDEIVAQLTATLTNFRIDVRFFKDGG